MGLYSKLAAVVLAVGIALPGAALAEASAGAVLLAQATGETCRVVEQTGFVREVASVPLQTTVTLGPDKEGLACDVGWQRIESAGEERCLTNYSDGTLYRNGQLEPVSRTSGDCRCQEGFDRTTCQISTAVQCSYEVMRTAGEQVCD